MRYEKGHKDATRRHVIEVASKQFRKGGIDAVGVAAVMSAAGLTNGAFYSHFKSKDALVKESICAALEEQKGTLREAVRSGRLEDAVRYYLSPQHRDDASSGCPSSALIAELSRQPRQTRSAYADGLSGLFDLLVEGLPGESLDARRSKAISLLGTMIGVLQLARAVTDKALSAEMLSSGLNAALAIIRQKDR
jgi:TetR/AcrR family transcriptional repressor of nem operon